MQVHDAFILEETDEGFALIDQHALHERILYEETVARLNARALESQRLLTPAVIEADQADIAAGYHWIFLGSCFPDSVLLVANLYGLPIDPGSYITARTF